MARVLGQDEDGAYRVETDTGQVVRVAPQGLPPGLRAAEDAGTPASVPGGTPAPAPEAPRLKILQPRADGGLDAVEVSPDTFTATKVSGETAQQLLKTGEWTASTVKHHPQVRAELERLRKESEERAAAGPAPQPPSTAEKVARSLTAASTGLAPAAPFLEAVSREPISRAGLESALGDLTTNPVLQLAPGAALLNFLKDPRVQQVAQDYSKAAGQTVGRSVKGLQIGASALAPNLVSPPAPRATPEQPEQKQLAPQDFALPAPAAPASAQATAQVQVPSFRAAPAGGGAGEKALANAFNQVQKTAGERAALEEVRAAGEAARQEEALQQAEAREAQRLQNEAARQAFVQGAEEQLRATLAETEKSTAGEVDPNRWWNSRTTGQRILAGVSSFLAGFANSASPIQQAIQQDIAVQRENLDRRGEAGKARVQGQVTLLGLMRQRFGDEIAAEKAAEAAALGLAQQRAQVLATRASGPEAKQRAAELVAQLEVQKQEKLAEYRTRAAQLALQRNAQELQAYGLRMEALATASKAGVFDEAVGPSTPVNRLTAEQRERFIPGLGLALDKEAAKEARKKTGNFRALDDLLAKAITMRGESGSETIPGPKRAALQAMGKRLELALKEDGELGALDKGSQDFLQEMVGGKLDSYGYVLPRLQALQESARAAYRAKVSPYMATSTTATTFTPAAAPQ